MFVELGPNFPDVVVESTEPSAAQVGKPLRTGPDAAEVGGEGLTCAFASEITRGTDGDYFRWT